MDLPRTLAILISALLWLAPAQARPPGREPWAPTNYAVYYGQWDEALVEQALGFELLILQPSGVTREQTRRLRAGRDAQSGTSDDVKVLAYVSLGEDETPPRGLAPAAASGPVHRQPGGTLAPGNNDFPTAYLDEVKLLRDQDGFFKLSADGAVASTAGQDGLPDENGVWGSFYTASGDPGWHETVRQRTLAIEQKLEVDGFFLDTLDTASRWGAYPWMEKDMVELVAAVRSWHPRAILVANRGLSLFYDHAEAMRGNLDGVMYESFLTDWDWQRKRAITHPFLDSQWEILRDLLLPQATRPDGFFLLFLNYRDPAQSDVPGFLQRERELLEGIPHAACWTTPDLQRLEPPAPPPSKVELHALEVVRAESTEAGTVRMTLKGKAPPDALVEIVSGLQPGPLSPRLRFARAGESTLEVWGVREQQLWVRVLGGGSAGPFQPVVVTGPLLPAVADLQVQGLEQKVRLSWKGVPRATYDVYSGESADRLKRVARVTVPEAVLQGLANDQIRAFAVAQIRNGKKVALSDVIYGAARDRTPPPSPAGVQVEGNRVTWQASPAPDLSGYRVYVWPVGKGPRLPLLVDADQTEVTVEHVQSAQICDIWVTARDESGNESRPAGRARMGP